MCELYPKGDPASLPPVSTIKAYQRDSKRRPKQPVSDAQLKFQSISKVISKNAPGSGSIILVELQGPERAFPAQHASAKYGTRVVPSRTTEAPILGINQLLP